jgi:hypothetical protein
MQLTKRSRNIADGFAKPVRLKGQVLYLEAEAAGICGTGIGCYFDDSVHELLGFKDDKFQSLYHFTVGKPLEDSRLQTLPAYGHLNDVV